MEKDESDLNAFNLNSEEIQDLPDYLFSNDKIYDSPNFSKSSGDPKHKMKIINLEEIIDKNEENTFNNEDVKDTNAKLIDQNKSKSIHIQNDNEFIVEKNRLINIQENKETNFTVVDQNKSRDIQENNESNIKVDDIQNESIDFQDKHENNNTIFEESSKLEKYKEGESISYSLEDLKNIEKKEIKLEDDLVKVFYKAISIKPIDPKFAKFSSPAQDVIKFEENDNLTEFSTQNNCKFLNDSNEEQYSSVPPKNPIIPSQKKFSIIYLLILFYFFIYLKNKDRLGKYADIALNLEELLGNRKEPPIVPKNDEYSFI